MSSGVGGLIEQNKEMIKANIDKEKQKQDAEAINAKAFQEKQKSRMKNSQRGMLNTNPNADSDETLGTKGL